MLNRAKRASHIDPPASSYAIMRRARPYRGENPAPGKDVHGELDPTPGIRERPRPTPDIDRIEIPQRCGLLYGVTFHPFGRTAGGQEATSSRKTSKGSSLTLTAAILEVEEFLTR
jgi:hypothetical protein